MHFFKIGEAIPCQWKPLNKEYSQVSKFKHELSFLVCMKQFKCIKLDMYLASNDCIS